MEELSAGVRDLHERVGRLDELLQADRVVEDLREKRADAAHDVAERTSRRVRLMLVAGVLVAFGWTPLTAYGAVWVHELVRNNCYASVEFADQPPAPADEPWYCGAFPGTDRHGAHTP